MNFNVNDFVNSFMNKIYGNKTNTDNNLNQNNSNNNKLFNYKETPDVAPQVKMSGSIAVPTQETQPPQFPRGTTGIVVAPTPTPTGKIMPDRPSTGIVVAPTPTPTVEVMPDRPTTGIVVAPTRETIPPEVAPTAGIVAKPTEEPTPSIPQKPTIWGKIFSINNSVFSKINNIFTSIFRRFW